MAPDAPGSARTRTFMPSATATWRASVARKASTRSRGASIPAIASVSAMIARSVRPAFGATAGSSRPNISRNTTSYRRVPRPSALTSV
jgi:hypothetical protein